MSERMTIQSLDGYSGGRTVLVKKKPLEGNKNERSANRFFRLSSYLLAYDRNVKQEKRSHQNRNNNICDIACA